MMVSGHISSSLSQETVQYLCTGEWNGRPSLVVAPSLRERVCVTVYGVA